MRPFPPWIERFLQAICPDDVFDQIVGDLVELYDHDCKSIGERKARFRLYMAVFRFFRPGILLRNRFSFSGPGGLMLSHYFMASCRHFLKSRLNFSFKVIGLVLALVSLMVITLYVQYETSFDKFQEDYHNVYRVNSSWRENNAMATYAIAPSEVGPMLKAEFPEITSYARVVFPSRYLVRTRDTSLHVDGIADADSTIFDVLTFTFIRGDKRSLTRSKSIVLTESAAKIIFGDDDPMGQTISIVDRGGIQFEVTGVIKDVPSNSHLDIQALITYGSFDDGTETVSGSIEVSIDGSTQLYVRLNDGIEPSALASRMTSMVRSRMTGNESGLEKEFALSLQPLHNIYLDPPIYAEFCRKGNVLYVYVFSMLAFFLLVISGINYTNLSVADFKKRSKEIGVRKVMGARKKQIAFHVFFEALLTLALSGVISLGILYLLLPEIHQMLNPHLKIQMLSDPKAATMLLAMIGLLVALSTVYPAFQLAVNNPVQDMKMIGKSGNHGQVSRILLITQFCISVICISSTLIVGQQLAFIQSRNPGYDKGNLIVAYMPDEYPQEKNDVIKEEFAKVAGVESVSFSTFRIAGAGYYRDWYRVEINGEMKQMILNEVFFDHDFFSTTGIPLAAGRSFDRNRLSDAHEAFIVNEAAVREFGWDEPIGKRISYGYEEPEGEKWEGTVIGVVKDFNVYSLHRKIEPLVMRLPWSEWPGSCVHIRINGPFDQTIAQLQNKYKDILPGFILRYSVVEDLYNNQYNNEKKVFSTLRLSTLVVVLICSLGIFSLSLYMSINRMKEFGIRKVLGATSGEIARLHINEFLKLVFIANGIGLPVAWMLGYYWLDQFAYRVDVSSLWMLFVGGLSLIIVIASSSYAAWKAGKLNPVDAIKSE